MKEFKENFNLKDWKIQLLAFGMVIAAELISTVKITLSNSGKDLSFSLIPMFFAIIIGIILASLKKINLDTMKKASPYISLSVPALTIASCRSIGPSWETIKSAGLAVVLQEFGNLGTLILAIPIGVLVFKMGRASIGAGFSISREGGMAIVAEKYGLDSPEGVGVIGAYITGTVVGTVFCGIFASIMAGTGLFHPYAMAMAAGTGSASMMAAQLAPLIEKFPEMEEAIRGFAASSQTLSNVDGTYMNVFLAIPLSELVYKIMAGKRDAKKTK